MMADFVALRCPSCSGRLTIAHDINRFACGYCGTEFLVRRSEDVVSLSPVEEAIHQVGKGVDRMAMELQVQRLQKERMELAEYIRIRRESYEYSYTTKSGLFGLIRGLTSSRKEKDRQEIEELRELAQQKRAEQESLLAVLSSW